MFGGAGPGAVGIVIGSPDPPNAPVKPGILPIFVIVALKRAHLPANSTRWKASPMTACLYGSKNRSTRRSRPTTTAPFGSTIFPSCSTARLTVALTSSPAAEVAESMPSTSRNRTDKPAGNENSSVADGEVAAVSSSDSANDNSDRAPNSRQLENSIQLWFRSPAG